MSKHPNDKRKCLMALRGSLFTLGNEASPRSGTRTIARRVNKFEAAGVAEGLMEAADTQVAIEYKRKRGTSKAIMKRAEMWGGAKAPRLPALTNAASFNQLEIARKQEE